MKRPDHYESRAADEVIEWGGASSSRCSAGRLRGRSQRAAADGQGHRRSRPQPV